MGEKVFRDAVAGLVPVEKVIPERFDDVIEGAGYEVGALLSKQEEERLYQPGNGADGTPVGGAAGRRPEVSSEEFVCAVNEVEFH